MNGGDRLIVRALRRILSGCLAVLFAGCAAVAYGPDLHGRGDGALKAGLLGRWCLNELSPDSRHSSSHYELAFSPDGSFDFNPQVSSDPSVSHPLPYRGAWTLSDGKLVQHWPTVNGGPRRVTTSPVLELRPRKLYLAYDSCIYLTFYRAPRSHSE